MLGRRADRRWRPVSALLPPGPAAPPASAAGATDLLTIFNGLTFNFLLVGDVGITTDVGVTTWADQSAAGKNAVQTTDAAEPTLQAAGLNGKDTVLFDGVAQRLVFSTLDLAAPLTTPSFFYAVLRVIADATNASPWGAGGTTMRLFRGTANNLRLNNANNGGLVALTAGSWVRAKALYSGSVSDYLQLGANTSSGVDLGNNNPGSGAFTIGCGTSAGTLPSNCEYACIAGLTSEPSVGQLADADAWVTAYYGGSVAL